MSHFSLVSTQCTPPVPHGWSIFYYDGVDFNWCGLTSLFCIDYRAEWKCCASILFRLDTCRDDATRLDEHFREISVTESDAETRTSDCQHRTRAVLAKREIQTSRSLYFGVFVSTACCARFIDVNQLVMSFFRVGVLYLSCLSIHILLTREEKKSGTGER